MPPWRCRRGRPGPAQELPLSKAASGEGRPVAQLWRTPAPCTFTQAFRALQGSVLLGMTGYYMQARALMRTRYESAGLGRLIAKYPQLAEKWLRKQQWVPDHEVRAGIEAQTVADGSSSPYAAHYRIASAAAHPTARATLGQVLTAGGGVNPVLSSVFVEDDLVMVLREAAALAVFACFALQRAAADERALPPAWPRPRGAGRGGHRSGDAAPGPRLGPGAGRVRARSGAGTAGSGPRRVPVRPPKQLGQHAGAVGGER